MKKAGKELLVRALAYLNGQARPLEARRWAFHTGTASREDVLSELQSFANPDGGFGNALEPDMRAGESSTLATLEALDIMAEINLPAGTPMLRRALDWLCRPDGGYDGDAGLWPYLKQMPRETARAPWWEMESLSETFGGFRVNPRGRVLAHLYRSGSSGPVGTSELGPHLEDILSLAETMDQASPDTLRSLMALREALENGHFDPESRRRLQACLIRLIPSSVEKDPSKWTEYGLQPLEVAESPDSPWLHLLEDDVHIHLDYLVENQAEDGSWAPFWTWGGRFPEAWDSAKKEWQGVLTLRNLMRLSAFGRL